MEYETGVRSLNGNNVLSIESVLVAGLGKQPRLLILVSRVLGSSST